MLGPVSLYWALRGGALVTPVEASGASHTVLEAARRHGSLDGALLVQRLAQSATLDGCCVFDWLRGQSWPRWC